MGIKYYVYVLRIILQNNSLKNNRRSNILDISTTGQTIFQLPEWNFYKYRLFLHKNFNISFVNWVLPIDGDVQEVLLLLVTVL